MAPRDRIRVIKSLSSIAKGFGWIASIFAILGATANWLEKVVSTKINQEHLEMVLIICGAGVFMCCVISLLICVIANALKLPLPAEWRKPTE